MHTNNNGKTMPRETITTAQTNKDHINVGDYVRSFDFAPYHKTITGESACFIEGIVTEIIDQHGYSNYKITVLKRVFTGIEEDNFNLCKIVPVNGTPTSMGRTTCFVEKI